MAHSVLLKRMLLAVPLVLVVMAINFFIIRLAPGDPVSYMISGMENAPPEFIEMKRRELNLDKPIIVQFAIYLRDVLRGDLGYSWDYKIPVLDIILSHLQDTLLLTVAAEILALVLGIYVGIVSAKRPHSRVDITLSTVALIAWSTPFFWMGMMFLLLFGLHLRWFPISGVITSGQTGFKAILDTLWHLFLPALCLGLGRLAMYSRLTRASMLEVLHQDYIVTAWSKGCDENTVFHTHAFRNALLPIVTYVGLRLQMLFAGSVLVETIFGWPGIGLLLFNSIRARDYSIIQGIFIIISIMTIVGNTISDILYSYLDPRIRY